MKRVRVRHAVRTLTCLMALGAVACGFETGPSLDVQVLQPELVPTAGAASLCCCRVTGQVANRSSVPVHVHVAFDSYAAGDPKPSGQAVDFVENLQPAESRAFTAVGFVQPCASISEFKLVQPLNVRAVWQPK